MPFFGKLSEIPALPLRRTLGTLAKPVPFDPRILLSLSILAKDALGSRTHLP